MAWDPNTQEILTFGGTEHPDLVDTWEWDGTTWHEISPATTPPGRGWFGLAFDPNRAKVVVFGDNDSPSQGLSLRADLWEWEWEWDGVDWRDVTPTTADRRGTRRVASNPSA